MLFWFNKQLHELYERIMTSNTDNIKRYETHGITATHNQINKWLLKLQVTETGKYDTAITEEHSKFYWKLSTIISLLYFHEEKSLLYSEVGYG